EKRSEQPTIIQKVRNSAADKIDLLFGEKAGTAKAMLIGMDEDIDRSVLRAYRNAGISHILCISGLHVSVIVAAVSFLLKKLKTGRYALYITTVLFLLGYTLLAGGSDSIVRAAVLNLILLTARIVRRRSDMLTALSVGFFVCVMLNPLCIFGIGFQISYGCVFTLICLADCFGENKILSAIGSAICGLVATTVILWNVNHEFAPLSVLFNLIAVPLAGVVLIVLLISLIVFVILGSAFPQIGIVAKTLIGLMDEIAMLSEKISWEIPVKSIQPIAVVCVFAAIFFMSKYLIAPRIVKIGCASAMLLVFAALLMLPTDMPPMRIDFLAHEYADTAVVRDNKGNCILIDAGNPYGGEYLASYGIEAEAVFLTSEAQRSIGGAEQYPSARFFSPVNIENGMKFQFSDNIVLMALKGDDETYADYLVSFNGENILLYMGSSAKDSNYPEAKVLKLSSDGKKNIAFAGNSGAEYVILREDTKQVDAISLQKAGVVTVTWDGELKVESSYDGRTISESTES
ncbi:MAG: ComEC/Rec2 family competence protein, partial [Christensenellaceae bacterium]|nr:ComEC/Rec2 family competence protein [Christensenellaceae bacterium]